LIDFTIDHTHSFAGYNRHGSQAATSITITVPATSNAAPSPNSASLLAIPNLVVSIVRRLFYQVILKNELDLLGHDSSESPLMFSPAEKARGSKSALWSG
jgi:hypothetical protein